MTRTRSRRCIWTLAGAVHSTDMSAACWHSRQHLSLHTVGTLSCTDTGNSQQLVHWAVPAAVVTVYQCICGLVMYWLACQTRDKEVAGSTPGHPIIRQQVKVTAVCGRGDAYHPKAVVTGTAGMAMAVPIIRPTMYETKVNKAMCSCPELF